jgi:hypothetical protein
MTDKLVSARLKIERAKKHFDELGRILDGFNQSPLGEILAQRDPESRRMVYRVGNLRPVPLEISAVVGDLLQCLRSSLDHLAFELWVAAGRQGDARNVYFPIYAKRPKSGFKPEIQSLPKPVVDAVEGVQPYNGRQCDQLRVLSELNNADKHRLIITVASYFGGIGISALFQPLIAAQFPGNKIALPDGYLRETGFPFPPKDGDEVFLDAPDAEVRKDLKFRFTVAFNEPGIIEREPIDPFLRQLGQFVENLLTSFEKFL